MCNKTAHVMRCLIVPEHDRRPVKWEFQARVELAGVNVHARMTSMVVNGKEIES